MKLFLKVCAILLILSGVFAAGFAAGAYSFAVGCHHEIVSCLDMLKDLP